MSLDSSNSGVGLQIFQEGQQDNVILPIHHWMPNSYSDEESARSGCTAFYTECRAALSRGEQVERVLGSPVLDVSGLVRPDQTDASHPLSRWAVLFTMDLSSPSWALQLATAYLVFHLMRVCYPSMLYSVLNPLLL